MLVLTTSNFHGATTIVVAHSSFTEILYWLNCDFTLYAVRPDFCQLSLAANRTLNGVGGLIAQFLQK